MPGLVVMPLRVLVVGLLGFFGALGTYLALALAGADTAGFVQFIVTAGALLGLGAHNEVRSRQQAHRISQNQEGIARIDHQTNGALTERIEKGSRKAVRETFREVGYPLAED